jgi:hypothetical protein
MKILFACSLAVVLFSQTAQADPTRPAPGWTSNSSSASAEVAAPLKLQLIKHTTAGPVAVINGQLLRRGDYYQQYQLLAIKDKQVVLQRNGEQQTLSLHNTVIKNYEN